MAKGKERHITTANMSKSCLALNPHLRNLPKGTEFAPGAPPAPLQAQRGPLVAEKAKRVKKQTKTEAEYEAILKREYPGAKILFERYTLKLANDCRYTPDFCVICDGEISFHEVKGAFLFRGATKSATHTSLTKPKMAAENYPWHRFCVAQKDKYDGWTREWLQPTIENAN